MLLGVEIRRNLSSFHSQCVGLMHDGSLVVTEDIYVGIIITNHRTLILNLGSMHGINLAAPKYCCMHKGLVQIHVQLNSANYSSSHMSEQSDSVYCMILSILHLHLICLVAFMVLI